VASARQRWKSELQPRFDPKKLVFIDETGTATNMARRRGRCRRGARLIGRVPHGHWKTTTLVAGLRIDAVSAPFVIDRAMNGRIFRTYVERCLVPTLCPGDIVIMDNLRAHKVTGVREAIEAVGAVLVYLPPYSPDLNPIEQLFAKLKALLRKAAKRTIEGLWSTIGRLLDDLSAEECGTILPTMDMLNLSGKRSSPPASANAAASRVRYNGMNTRLPVGCGQTVAGAGNSRRRFTLLGVDPALENPAPGPP
jgi:transposase